MMQHARTRVDAAAWRGRRTLGLAGLTVGGSGAHAACSSGTSAGSASGTGSASTASSSALVIDSTFDLEDRRPGSLV